MGERLWGQQKPKDKEKNNNCISSKNKNQFNLNKEHYSSMDGSVGGSNSIFDTSMDSQQNYISCSEQPNEKCMKNEKSKKKNKETVKNSKDKQMKNRLDQNKNNMRTAFVLDDIDFDLSNKNDCKWSLANFKIVA